jgi:hypothetical protein
MVLGWLLVSGRDHPEIEGANSMQLNNIATFLDKSRSFSANRAASMKAPGLSRCFTSVDRKEMELCAACLTIFRLHAGLTFTARAHDVAKSPITGKI